MTQEEKFYIAKLLRQETGCGMMEASKAIDKLIDAFKHRPRLVMDRPQKIKITFE